MVQYATTIRTNPTIRDAQRTAILAAVIDHQRQMWGARGMSVPNLEIVIDRVKDSLQYFVVTVNTSGHSRVQIYYHIQIVLNTAKILSYEIE